MKDGMEASITEQKLWTSLSIINWSTDYLASKDIDSPRLTCELLLARVLRCSRIDLYTKFDRPLLQEELIQFKLLFKRRLLREPLQYILAETEFMGLKFNVDRRVLIPRPETEIVVEQVIALAKRTPLAYILDIGTGSGNIAISLATCLDKCEIDAVDVSSEALEVARHNLELHRCGRRVNLIQCDVLQEDLMLPRERYDLIVSNPPYISQAEFRSLQVEVRDFEPMIATTDGADGLKYYHAIADIGKRYLVQGGWIVVEHAYNQSDAVRSLFFDTGYSDIEITYDYTGTPRVVKARWL